MSAPTITVPDSEFNPNDPQYQVLAEIALGVFGPTAQVLEAAGWRAWYAHLFGQGFVDILDSAETDDKHHSEAIEWHWESRRALLQGKRPPNDWFAYFPTWARANMKSSVAEAMVVTDAGLSVLYGEPGYAQYIGREKTRIQESIHNIELMLSGEKVRKLFPTLSQVARNEETNQRRQWTGTYLHTKAGYIIKGGTIESAQAGSRVVTEAGKAGTRPTFQVPDDIDGRDDSPVIAASILKALTTEILPMRQANTLTFWAQNLISRYTARYQIETQQVRVLTNRKPTVRVPAVRDLKTEPRTVDGIIRDVFISGRITWRGWTRERVQDEINAEGLLAFLKECHPAGTMIRLASNQIVPIERVTVGDSVITHHGRARMVSELVRRKYSGTLVSICRAGSSDILEATETHPFYIARRPKKRWQWHTQKDVKNSVDYTERDRKVPERLKREWAPAASLEKGDFLLEPLPVEPESYLDGSVIWKFTPKGVGRSATGNKAIKATQDLFRLVGYYLAEGGVSESAVILTFHEDEVEYYEDVERLFRRVFGVPISASPSNGKSVQISTGSAIAREFFEWVGKGSKTKSIPQFVFQASPLLVRELLIGYMRGDGCKDPSGFTYNTTSEQLAEGVRLLMLRLGVVASVYRLKPRTVKLPQGTLYERSEHWQGDINGGFAKDLGRILGYPHESRGRNSAFIHNCYVYRPIRSVTHSVVQWLPVYNFEVDEDNSFLADGIASHNCQHEVEQSKEGLVLQNWDDGVHVISLSQFERIYGTRDLPRYWSKYVYNDWARTKTKYHANVAGTVTVSPQNTRLPGCVFVFNPMSFNAGTAPEDVALRLLKTICPTTAQGYAWEEVIKSTLDRGHLERYITDTTRLIEQRRVLLADVIPKYVEPIIRAQGYQVFRCSHERTDVQRVYRTVFGLPFNGINPGADGGVDTINLLQRVDYTQAHPIIPNKKGYTRFFLVVDDDLSRPCLTIDLKPVTYGDGKVVYEPVPYRDSLTPDELVDADLFRYQCRNWRLRDPYLTSKGETEGELLKMNDDHGNGLMMLFYDGCVQAVALTEDEVLYAATPAGYHKEELKARTDLDPAQKAMTEWWVEKQVRKSLKPRSVEVDDYGEVI